MKRRMEMMTTDRLMHVTDEAAADQFIAAANAFRMQKMGMEFTGLWGCLYE